MNNNINAQLNNSDCIQSNSGITGTGYYNICTGTKSFVPYGLGDIVVAILVGLFFICIIYTIIKLTIVMIND